MSGGTRTGLAVADFLLERLDEDYETAYGADPSPWRQGAGVSVLDRHGHLIARCEPGGTFGHILRFDPTAVLADIEAKRAVVYRCSQVDYLMPSTHLAFGILAELAVAYSQHEDYREDWRP